MNEFNEWILEQFANKNENDKWWKKFKKTIHQNDVQSYVMIFQRNVMYIDLSLNENVQIHMFLDNLKPELLAKWKHMRDKSQKFLNIIRLLVDLEQVLNAAKWIYPSFTPSLQMLPATDSDAMDLNAITAKPFCFKKTSLAWSLWCKKHNACYNCGTLQHKTAECPILKKSLEKLMKKTPGKPAEKSKNNDVQQE